MTVCGKCGAPLDRGRAHRVAANANHPDGPAFYCPVEDWPACDARRAERALVAAAVERIVSGKPMQESLAEFRRGELRVVR